MTLRLLPTPEKLPPAEKVRQRVKRMARPDGMLQCNRCGGRTVMTATNSVMIENGRKKGGTVIHKDVCLDCYRHGIITPMMPALERIK